MASILPAIIPGKKDALSRIKEFMSNQESGIILTSLEEKMLDRMILANSFLSENKYSRDEVAEKIKVKFGVSVWTARKDINNAYTLFSTVTEDYKRYTLEHHVDYINKLIQKWSADKSLAGLVPKLLAEKTRAIAAMPTKPDAPDVPAPVLNIHVTSNIEIPLTDEEALKKADQLIALEKEQEYIEFDDVKKEDAE